MTTEDILRHLLAIAIETGVDDRFYNVSCKYCKYRDSNNGYCPIASIGDWCIQETDEAIAILLEHWQEV